MSQCLCVCVCVCVCGKGGGGGEIQSLKSSIIMMINLPVVSLNIALKVLTSEEHYWDPVSQS